MRELTVEVSEELRSAWPQFRGAAVFADVVNTQYDEALWKRIEEYIERHVSLSDRYIGRPYQLGIYQ